MPTPSTPAQPRFLPLKSQKTKGATPLQGGAHQFASTPRFNVPKTTPRPAAIAHQPPPFSTPAQSSARFRATQYEPLSDSIDTSPISSDLPLDGGKGVIPLNESIEEESESPSLSGDDGDRPSKRRRVSISPMVTPDDDDYHESMDLAGGILAIDYTPLSAKDEIHSKAEELRPGSGEPPSSPAVATRHPTFLSAPRFKPSEAVEADQNRPPLPDAFSPQRRGAKYVPGGLAAELRDWLVQVKGASEYDRPEGQSMRLNVEEVITCQSGGMCILSGAEVADVEGDMRTQKGGESNQSAKVILAGDGRIDGLKGKNSVACGKTLSLFQPMWDIALENSGRFAVVCDWDDETVDIAEGEEFS